MDLTETIRTVPITAEKTVRETELRCLTSGVAGKILPLVAEPMLREDRVSRGRCRVRFEMMETVETLLNAVNVTTYVHFVPFLAMDRFNGLDHLNRAYKGEPEVDASVTPFFETGVMGASHKILDTLGLHAPTGSNVNMAYIQAYNALVNFRRKARSAKLPLRTKNAATLARAFWKNTAMGHIVPDFDQAMLDGELDLNIASAQLPVKGIFTMGAGVNATKSDLRQSGDTATTSWSSQKAWWAGSNDPSSVYIKEDGTGFPEIYAELAQQGITLSLSNIEMAKKTAAFAALRKQYSGLDDDHLIDMLMEGIRIPDAQMAQPILLDRKSTIIGYSKRFATDSGNLDKSVTTGETVVDLSFRTPPMNTGGIIMVTAEIVPEQMFERQKDTFFFTGDTAALPSFTRDFLDPEKVDVVPNDFVDVLHSDPNGTFGYAPLNHAWRHRNFPRIGGKFKRAVGDPFDEDRQRIWDVETVDPTLTEDFYLCTGMHHNVFADTVSDPFEVTTLGRIEYVGNTVFGKGLQENTDDYAEIVADVDTGRIDQTA